MDLLDDSQEADMICIHCGVRGQVYVDDYYDKGFHEDTGPYFGTSCAACGLDNGLYRVRAVIEEVPLDR